MYSRSREFGYLIVEGASNSFRNPRRGVATTLFVATSFLVLGLALVLHNNTKTWMKEWTGPQLSLQLAQVSTGGSPGRAPTFENTEGLRQALTDLEAVVGVRYVSELEAARQLGEYVDQDRELLALLRQEVRPSIEVLLESGIESQAVLRPMLSRLERIPGVESVELLSGWSSSIRGLVNSLNRWLQHLVLLLFIAAAVAVILGVRLACVESGRDVSLWRMLGARTGTLIGSAHGAALGGAGALLGLITLWGLFHLAMQPALQNALVHVGDLTVTFLPWYYCIAFVFAGIVLGAIGGSSAVEANDYAG